MKSCFHFFTAKPKSWHIFVKDLSLLHPRKHPGSDPAEDQPALVEDVPPHCSGTKWFLWSPAIQSILWCSVPAYWTRWPLRLPSKSNYSIILDSRIQSAAWFLLRKKTTSMRCHTGLALHGWRCFGGRNVGPSARVEFHVPLPLPAPNTPQQSWALQCCDTPQFVRIHLWFGRTTKTTRQSLPTLGHLAGNSGQKPLQGSWSWPSLPYRSWCLCWECQWCSFPRLSHPVLCRLQHLEGGMSWQGLLRNILKTWRDRRLSPKPSETHVLLWLSFLDALTAFLATRPLAEFSEIVGFLHQKTKRAKAFPASSTVLVPCLAAGSTRSQYLWQLGSKQLSHISLMFFSDQFIQKSLQILVKFTIRNNSRHSFSVFLCLI